MTESCRSTTQYCEVYTRESGAIRMLSLTWFHGREQYHIPYRRAVGEQHDEPVHAHAQAARGRKAVFERGDEILVDLRIAAGLLRPLLLYLLNEALLLVDGVVELGEGVAEFVPAYEIFKPLGKGGIGRLALCKRRIFDGVVVDYGGCTRLSSTNASKSAIRTWPLVALSPSSTSTPSFFAH